ncbi:BspA family leucine-rich repeat surface protein, partial [Enterococcus faecalis]|uniref:BspA family leucine-rich repeat surface protein n=1 Tax=Enterococcus faecalis TaxID=1351 RepID=UPI001A9696CA
VLLSSFLLPGSSIYAESVNSSDQTTDSKEIIEKSLEKDSLLPTNPSVPSVQTDTASSETEQNDSTSGEKEESQKQEETIANDSNIEENNTETSSNNEELQDDQNGSVSTYSSINPRATGYDNTSAPYESYDEVNVANPVLTENGYVYKNDIDVEAVILLDYIGNNPDIVTPLSLNGGRGVKTSSTFFLNIAHRGVKSIKVSGKWYSAAHSSTSWLDLFKDCTSLETVDFSNMNIYFATSMESMFEGCTNLKEVRFRQAESSWQVSSMANMFANTPSLEYVNVAYWNTDNLRQTNGMFNGSGISEVNLSNWNFNNVWSTTTMFSNSSVKKVSFGTNEAPNLRNMHYMFSNTPNLETIDLNFSFASASTMKNMFDGSGIKKLNLSTWSTTQTNIDMSNMFANTPNLREVDMRGFTNLDS